jgi:RNA polymerase sigma-70 factor (ECF subfamily)
MRKGFEGGMVAGQGEVWQDRQLLEGVRRREPEALKRFYDVAFPYVYNLAYRFAGHRPTAEDIAQEVFIKVYGAADRLDVERSAKPWLTTVVYNTCRDSARRLSARPEDAVDATDIGLRPSTASNPEQDFIQKERDALVNQALLRLDESSRLVIILHTFCDYTHEDVAQVTGDSTVAVRKRHSRAIKRMAEIVQELQA